MQSISFFIETSLQISVFLSNSARTLSIIIGTWSSSSRFLMATLCSANCSSSFVALRHTSSSSFSSTFFFFFFTIKKRCLKAEVWWCRRRRRCRTMAIIIAHRTECSDRPPPPCCAIFPYFLLLFLLLWDVSQIILGLALMSLLLIHCRLHLEVSTVRSVCSHSVCSINGALLTLASSDNRVAQVATNFALSLPT